MRQDHVIEFDELLILKMSAQVRYSFLLHWVRRVGVHEVLGDIGTPLGAPDCASVNIEARGNFRMVKSVDAAGQMRLRVYRSSSDREPAISVTTMAPAQCAMEGDPLLALAGGMRHLSTAVHALAGKCLQNRYELLVSRIINEADTAEPLVDISFPNTEAGVEARMKAVNGDFTAALEFDINELNTAGALASMLSGVAGIEIFFPYPERKDWKSPSRAMKHAQVHSNDAGQIFVGSMRDSVANALRLAAFASISSTSSASAFSFNHIAPASEGGATIMRQIPGNYLTAWFDAPGDRDPAYGPVYRDIALTVQRVLRHEIPRRWFSETSRYGRFAESYAMLAYKCSKPFTGKTRTECSYDFQSPVSMRRFYRTALVALPAELESHAANLSELTFADVYRPKAARTIIDSVQTRSRNLDRLMAAESSIIECFIEFGIAGKDIRQHIETHPEDAAEQMARYAESFARTLQYRVRRIHPTLDCDDLANLLLMEASSTLSGAIRGDWGVCTILHKQTQHGSVYTQQQQQSLEIFPESWHFLSGRKIS